MEIEWIQKLRDLLGKLQSQHVYRRYQLGDRVRYFDPEKGWDEGRVVGTREWGDYTVENPDRERRILSEKELRPLNDQ